MKKYLAEIDREGGLKGKSGPVSRELNRHAALIRRENVKAASKSGENWRKLTFENIAPVLESRLLELKRRLSRTNIRHDEQLLALLDDRERKIIYGRFVNGKTLQEIGDEFGLTRERIRQIEEHALRKINRGLWKANGAESEA